MVFVNRFEVHGPPDEFERRFRETSEFFRRQPGFLSFRLVRSIEQVNQYVNIAEWESPDHLRAAIAQPEFAEHSAALRALATSSPAMHRPVFDAVQPVS